MSEEVRPRNYNASELDLIAQELASNNLLATEAGKRRGIEVDPKIRAATIARATQSRRDRIMPLLKAWLAYELAYLCVMVFTAPLYVPVLFDAVYDLTMMVGS